MTRKLARAFAPPWALWGVLLVEALSAQQAPRILMFKAVPESIDAGQTASLMWSVENAAEVVISGVGPVGSSGTAIVSPASTTTYTLTARNAYGQAVANARVLVFVLPVPPDFTLSADSLGFFDVEVGGSRILELSVEPNRPMDFELVMPPIPLGFSVRGPASFSASSRRTIEVVFAPAAAAAWIATLDVHAPEYSLSRSVPLWGNGVGRDAPAATGVWNAASGTDLVAPNTWVSIGGARLAASTRSWMIGDFDQDKLPTQLDGVSVTIGGRPVSVSYISPAQINALLPAIEATGSVTGFVSGPAGRTGVFTLRQRREAPAFFTYSAENGRYAAATLPDGTCIGKAGLLGPNVRTRPAKPGDMVAFYLNGLGPAASVIPDGRLIAAPIPLPGLPTLRIGDRTFSSEYAFLVSPGLYQVGGTIPETGDGDFEIVLRISGVETKSGVWITISRQ